MRLQRACTPRNVARQHFVPSSRLPRRSSHASRSAGPIAAYNEGVRVGRLREDPAQRIALQKFNRLFQDISQYAVASVILLSFLAIRHLHSRLLCQRNQTNLRYRALLDD